MDRRAWQATAHRVIKRLQLSKNKISYITMPSKLLSDTNILGLGDGKGGNYKILDAGNNIDDLGDSKRPNYWQQWRELRSSLTYWQNSKKDQKLATPTISK